MTALCSAPIPGLPPAPPSPDPDLRIHLGNLPDVGGDDDAPWFTSPRADSAGEPLLVASRIGDGRHHLRYADETEFVVDVPAGEVWARWPEAATVEDTATYLLGPVMGFLLRMRGVTCLHASAVEIAGEAVVVTGPAGAGKSTTAAAFARAGRRVLADDIVPLLPRGDGGFDAQPAYPQLRLWPDSAGALFGDEDALPRLTPGWDKRYLDLSAGGAPFRDEPLPLGAVYLLAGREEGAGEPRLEPLQGGDALMGLVANVYMGYLPGPEERARDLARLAALAARVPVVRVTPPEDPARIAELARAIAEDHEARAGRT